MQGKVDAHIHTANSHDGKLPIAKLVQIAKRDGLSYMCTTDHCDFDIKYGPCRAPYRGFLNLDKYYEEWKIAKQALDEDKNNTLTLAFGIEAGFCDDEKVYEKYAEIMQNYPFDEVINSVHCVNGKEAYFKSAFLFKSKAKMYGDYLDTVLKSLDAPYRYDIVAHIGYISHGAPYRDKALRYADFPDKIDAILCGIIERGKVLEVNFHHDMNPPVDILKRYFELGGRKVSYGGDSHRGELCARFEESSKLLRSLGFENYSVFVGGKETLVPIEG